MELDHLRYISALLINFRVMSKCMSERKRKYDDDDDDEENVNDKLAVS